MPSACSYELSSVSDSGMLLAVWRPGFLPLGMLKKGGTGF